MIPASTRLRRAINLRSISLVRRIIESSASSPELIRNPDETDNGNTSLHLAAQLGVLDIAVYLIVKGHEDDGISRNLQGQTPLIIACQAGEASTADEVIEGRIAVGKLLIEKFPGTLDIRDADGMDAFSHSARHGTNPLLSLMLVLARPQAPAAISTVSGTGVPAPGPSPGPGQQPPSRSGTPAPPSSSQSSASMPPAISSARPAVSSPQPSIAPPPTPPPPRPQVSMRVRLLQSADAKGNTPLHHASAFGHLKTLRLLVIAGADATARNHAHWTPMDYSYSVAAEVYLRGLVREREQRAAASRQNAAAAATKRRGAVRLVESDDDRDDDATGSEHGAARLRVRAMTAD